MASYVDYSGIQFTIYHTLITSDVPMYVVIQKKV